MAKNKIIEKIKSLVKKTNQNIFGSKGGADITADVARKIQKTAYDMGQQVVKRSKTPTYLTIAEQLDVKEDQIFRAAVFSLTNIAKNEKVNARTIIAILEKNTELGAKTEEQAAYVKAKIEEIKSFYKMEVG